ncbi:MAG: FecR domain-containing protein [bacterium]
MNKFMTTIAGGLLALSLSSVGMAEVRALSVTGIVRMAMPGNEVGSDVRAGQTLPVGAEVRTTANGRVTLEFGPGNTVRLRENGRLVISEPKAKETRIQFLAGRMKGVFNRLTGGQQFSIQFASGAVCSVKGTTLVIEQTPEGFAVQTLFGVVEMSKDGKISLVPQGCGAALTSGGSMQVATLSDNQIDAGLASWDTESGAADTAKDEATTEREALRAVVASLRVDVQNSHESVAKIKEDDFATGRSLKDIHGNLARVEQRLMRPEPNHIQFVNLVKRETYRYSGMFQYAGPAGPRLDYLQFDAWLNIDLPETLTEWPQYFIDKAEADADVNPIKMVVMLANGGSGDANRDVFMNTAVFHEETETMTKQTGGYWDDGCQCTRNSTYSWTETRLKSEDTITLNGKPLADDPLFHSSDYDVKGFDENGGSLWARSVVAFRPAQLDAAGVPLRTVKRLNQWGGIEEEGGKTIPDLTQAPIYMNLEGYLINNEGINMAVADFTGGGQDPITLLKSIAGEGIICFTDRPERGTNLLGKAGGPSNIDLIVTPDIFLSIVQKVAESGQIPTMDSSSSDSSSN